MGEAPDGLAAVRLIHDLRPDVITLDVEMPRMTGLEVLAYVMSEIPTPVVMLTGYRPRSGDGGPAAGRGGFIRKPSGTISVDLYRVGEELIQKVRMAPLSNSGRSPQPISRPRPVPRPRRRRRWKWAG